MDRGDRLIWISVISGEHLQCESSPLLCLSFFFLLMSGVRLILRCQGFVRL